jgi:amino acid adenylation domain-containing protein
VREAVVAARRDATGELSLAAYVVERADREGSTAGELRQWLLGRIPEYMVPSAFVSLEVVPLTPNGKIDRQALPEPDLARSTASSEFVPPGGPVEELVASGWAAVLGVERIGAHDNFFDLGGHSLLATQVVSRLRDALGVEIPLRMIFEAPTVAALAERIEAFRGGRARQDAAPIEPIPRVSPMPLSFSQEALWFIDQLAPGQPTFNVSAALRIAGPLDKGALERSISALASRHESLRTTFSASGGTPQQVIAPDLRLNIDVVDLTGLAPGDREAEAKRRAIDESRRPFDLAHGPLARVSLLRLGDSDHAVVLTMHHLITDAWSLGVAADELIALYEADRQGRPAHLPTPPVQYADFARWQRNQFETGAWTSPIERWRRRLTGVPSLELPTDRPRPAIRSARGAQHRVTLSRELSEAVRALGRREGVTPFMTLLAAFQVLLGRWSGQDDFAVGSPVANRTRMETERLIGYFVNMLALRADLSGNPTVRELLVRVRDVALEAFENQETPLEVLIPALGPQRDSSRSPLFQVMFLLQNNPLPAVRPHDLALSPLHWDEGTGTSKFDLALGFEDAPAGFGGSVEFNTDLFDWSTIERFSRQYIKLVELIVADPDRRLSELSLLSDQERQQVAAWGGAASREPQCLDSNNGTRPPGIHGRFEAQVRVTPDRLALVADVCRLTYSELNGRANRLAHYLRSYGAGPEVRIGLILDESLNRIVAVLGVLKAGAAYVPLEPSLPAARLESMLNAAGVAIVIVDRGAQGRAPQTVATLINLDADVPTISGPHSKDPSVHVDNDNIAYVVFTSGTTGRPKGVMVSHGGLLSVAAAWEEAYELRQAPLRHLQAAGFAFDVFTGDWLRALTTGGTLFACVRDVVLDPRALAKLIDRERIECLELVPAVAESLAAHLEQAGGSLPGLKLLAIGSDTLRQGLYDRLRRLTGRATRVINSYGLTEATIDSTYFEGPPEGSIDNGPVPIGRPLVGTRIYVLDSRCEPVPVGSVGEVCVSGPGVARGYIDNPALTAERFIPDPDGEPGSRMYATGDRARWREGGALELLGRQDGQVQVRGFRVELAEVEAAITACAGVREVAVIAREDTAGDQRLIGCIVGEDGQNVRVDAIRKLLRDRLPRPMVPSRFQIVPALPRTPSGKIDRRTLLESLPEVAGADAGQVRPRDEVEEQLATIWEDLLQVRPIGVTDDFFDMGGHSLLAVRLAARIEEHFGRSLVLSDLLKGSTIEALAAQLREPVAERGRSLMVDLGARGPGLPLVLVHPIGGGVLCYGALARCLAGARDVIGIEAAGYETDEEPETGLVQMAARYVDALVGQRPQGPYLLGGWSMGGVVAFEMARQLAAARHEVPLVVLIDSAVPARPRVPRSFDVHESVMDFAVDLARTAGVDAASWLERLRGLDPESIFHRGFYQAIQRSEIVGEIGPDRLRRLHDVFRANRLALDGYQPRAFSGRVVLIRAESRFNGHEAAAAGGWDALALGGVTTHHLPGDHYMIMQPPAVERLAEIVAGEIERHEQTTGVIGLR